MVHSSVNIRRHKTYWGSALLVAGLLALLLNVAPAVACTVHLFASFKNGMSALFSSVGLSLLHAVGSVALGQVDYATIFARILVSFSAMVAIILGIALMRSRSSKNGAANSLSLARNDREAQ